MGDGDAAAACASVGRTNLLAFGVEKRARPVTVISVSETRYALECVGNLSFPGK